MVRDWNEKLQILTQNTPHHESFSSSIEEIIFLDVGVFIFIHDVQIVSLIRDTHDLSLGYISEWTVEDDILHHLLILPANYM